MCIYPYKRDVDELLKFKVGVIIKVVVVFRTHVVWVQELRWLLTVVFAGQSVQHLDVNANGC